MTLETASKARAEGRYLKRKDEISETFFGRPDGKGGSVLTVRGKGRGKKRYNLPAVPADEVDRATLEGLLYEEFGRDVRLEERDDEELGRVLAAHELGNARDWDAESVALWEGVVERAQRNEPVHAILGRR
jgi:hypothetical protein